MNTLQRRSVVSNVRTVRPFEQLPVPLAITLRNHRILPTRFILLVTVASQSMQLWQRSADRSATAIAPVYSLTKRCRVSTSRFGIGQRLGSNRTPLGLHRIAAKIGGGQPIGTVFRGRQPVGFTWQGLPEAPIVHRILWLDGLEPGWNHGSDVDSFRRYIYIHGTSDELFLGRPASSGCIHVAVADLIPLYDLLPVGTLVWISR